MTMGEKIKFHREQQHMTLEELGNKVGVGKSTVRKWENGMIANMRRDKISKIANALCISPAYLMGWTDNPDPNYPYSNEFVEELATNANRNMRNMVMKAFNQAPSQEESNPDPKLDEWIALFNGFSDEQRDKVIEFLHVFAEAKPEALSVFLDFVKSLS